MTEQERPESVISNLKILRTWCAEDPSYDKDECKKALKWLDDAIDMLKAQEPVEPKMIEFVDEGVTWEKYEVPTCGVCSALLGDARFCPMCGRAVKWE